MLKMFEDIKELTIAFEATYNVIPQVPNEETKRLRHTLISEEVEETLKAIREDDLTEIADGIADSIVVLLGTAVAYGIDMEPVWNEVHRSNMAKVKDGLIRRADGKILKPEGWTPPDIEGVLAGLTPADQPVCGVPVHVWNPYGNCEVCRNHKHDPDTPTECLGAELNLCPKCGKHKGWRQDHGQG